MKSCCLLCGLGKSFSKVEKIEVDWRDRRIIINLYMQQAAVVRLENGGT